jgi:hypothetical protein
MVPNHQADINIPYIPYNPQQFTRWQAYPMGSSGTSSPVDTYIAGPWDRCVISNETCGDFYEFYGHVRDFTIITINEWEFHRI